MLRFVAIMTLVCTLYACPPSDQIPPDCIQDLITALESNPPANPPASLYQYQYHGETVYYLSPQAGDIFSNLYNEDCEIICHPDGGITGTGDGQCPDFADTRTDERLVWKDNRGGY